VSAAGQTVELSLVLAIWTWALVVRRGWSGFGPPTGGCGVTVDHISVDHPTSAVEPPNPQLEGERVTGGEDVHPTGEPIPSTTCQRADDPHAQDEPVSLSSVVMTMTDNT